MSYIDSKLDKGPNHLDYKFPLNSGIKPELNNTRQMQIMRGKSEKFIKYNIVLLEGQPAVEIDTMKLKIGDGVTKYNDLPYIGRCDPIDLTPYATKEDLNVLVGDNVDETLDTIKELSEAVKANKDLLDTIHTNKDVLDKLSEDEGKLLYNGEEIEIDLTPYATKEYVDGNDHSHSNTEVLAKLAESADGKLVYNEEELIIPDLTPYATKEYVDAKNHHTHNNDTVLDKLTESNGKLLYNGEAIEAKEPDLSSYATKEYVDSKDHHSHSNSTILNKITESVNGKLVYNGEELSTPNLSSYATKNDLNALVGEGVDETLDTIKEISEAVKANKDLLDGIHTHTNSTVLEKFAESANGKLLYNGKEMESSGLDQLSELPNTLDYVRKPFQWIGEDTTELKFGHFYIYSPSYTTDTVVANAERGGTFTWTNDTGIVAKLTGKGISRHPDYTNGRIYINNSEVYRVHYGGEGYNSTYNGVTGVTYDININIPINATLRLETQSNAYFWCTINGLADEVITEVVLGAEPETVDLSSYATKEYVDGKGHHAHTNSAVLDKLTESNGKLLYNGEAIEAATPDLSSYATKNDLNALVGEGVDETLDTIKEISEAVKANKDLLDNIHTNKDVLDKFTESEGKLLYNGKEVIITVEDTEVTESDVAEILSVLED